MNRHAVSIMQSTAAPQKARKPSVQHFGLPKPLAWLGEPRWQHFQAFFGTVKRQLARRSCTSCSVRFLMAIQLQAFRPGEKARRRSLQITIQWAELILQLFRHFTYVTSSSLNSPDELPMTKAVLISTVMSYGWSFWQISNFELSKKAMKQCTTHTNSISLYIRTGT